MFGILKRRNKECVNNVSIYCNKPEGCNKKHKIHIQLKDSKHILTYSDETLEKIYERLNLYIDDEFVLIGDSIVRCGTINQILEVYDRVLQP